MDSFYVVGNIKKYHLGSNLAEKEVKLNKLYKIQYLYNNTLFLRIINVVVCNKQFS